MQHMVSERHLLSLLFYFIQWHRVCYWCSHDCSRVRVWIFFTRFYANCERSKAFTQSNCLWMGSRVWDMQGSDGTTQRDAFVDEFNEKCRIDYICVRTKSDSYMIAFFFCQKWKTNYASKWQTLCHFHTNCQLLSQNGKRISDVLCFHWQ